MLLAVFPELEPLSRDIHRIFPIENVPIRELGFYLKHEKKRRILISNTDRTCTSMFILESLLTDLPTINKAKYK